MDRKAHAISFARQAYLRQGLDTLYGQSFDDLLLPELDDAWDVAEAGQLIWCEDPKASPHNCVCGLRPIFCPIRAVIKGGNTYSIPAHSIPAL